MSSKDPTQPEASALSSSTTESEMQPISHTKKQNKKTRKLPKGYPSRFQFVGEVWCLFLSCYRKGRFPICSIGPSWAFTGILLVVAIMFLIILGVMIGTISDANIFLKYFCIGTCALNLSLMFYTMLGDPGIKKETYVHYTKIWFSGGKDLFTEDSDDNETTIAENDDLESNSPSLKKRHERKEKLKTEN